MTTRLHGEPRRCPVPVRRTRKGAPIICARTVPAGDLMCGDHWRALPVNVRLDVQATWKAWETDGFGDPDAHTAYLTARAEALDRAEEAVIPKR